METQVQPINPDSDIDGMNAEQLEAELAKCLGLTERTICRAAKITVRLIQMGREPQLKWRRWLQSIGSGLLHEKAFIKFFTNKPLLKKLEHISRQDQLAVVTGEKQIPLAVIIGDNITSITKKLEDMDNSEIALAFSNDGFRSIKKQKERLEKPLKKAIKAKNKSFFIDPKSKCLKHSSMFVKDSDGNKIHENDLIRVLSERYNISGLEEYIVRHAESLE